MTAPDANLSAVIHAAATDAASRAQLYLSESIFRLEQDRLARQAWHLLGLTGDVAADGDWLADRIGGCPVVVQRRGAQLHGHRNMCVACARKLTTEAAGHGSLRCARCGNPPADPIGLEICGSLICGRLAAPAQPQLEPPGLAASLGEWTAGIVMLTTALGPPLACCDQAIAANWKFSFQMTLDDYHLVQIHPGSFGGAGYLPLDSFRYFAQDRHSAVAVDRARTVPPDWLTVFLAACRRGELPLDTYALFQIFPHTLLGLMEHRGVWFVVLARYLGSAADTGLVRRWLFRAPGQAPDVGEPDADATMIALLEALHTEDRQAAEQLQRMARQAPALPLFGATEQRIAWFERAYRDCMLGAEAANRRTVSA